MTAAAWAKRLTQPEQRVLAVLRARAAADGGRATLTYDTLAKAAMVARGRIGFILRGLVDLGLVEHAEPVANPTGHWTASYRVLPVVVEAGGERLELPDALPPDALEMLARRSGEAA